MAVSQCPWPAAGLRRAQFRGFFPRFDRSTDTEQVGIEPNFVRRSWPLPLPRTSRAALRSPRDAGWVLPRHQPDAPTMSTPFFTPKKLAAFLIALAMLWPEITRFLSALARLLR